MNTVTSMVLMLAISAGTAAAQVQARAPSGLQPVADAGSRVIPAPAAPESRPAYAPAPVPNRSAGGVRAAVPIAPPAPPPVAFTAGQPAWSADLPPEATGQDPADVLWNQARAEMNRQNFARAAELFQRLIDRYASSDYTPNAYYWAAFSLYKRNGMSDLREAKRLLETQKAQHPQANTRSEGEALLVRISGELASRGDAESAQIVARRAAQAATQECPESDDEVRAEALNALMRMGSANAVTMLRQIMGRRDACSVKLRRNAVFLITRQSSPEREDMLLEAVRSDPDPEVKKNAVFWMSESPSERSLEAIQEALRSTNDAEIQQVAVHALSRHRSPKASQVLRELAESRNTRPEVRQAAVHWIGQKQDPENGPFLRSLFTRVDEVSVKESILHIISQRRDPGNDEWLLSIARDANQPVQVRKNALFWASERRSISTAEFGRLYDSMPNVEMKQQILYSLSRRSGDAAALDKLIDIAKNDRDGSLRKTAIFWLGQSKDPRAIKALQEIAGL